VPALPLPSLPGPVSALVAKVAGLEFTRPRLYAGVLLAAGVILVYYGVRRGDEQP
jgi:hypothetical protein